MRLRHISLAMLFSVFFTFAQDDESKFRVYGFADMSIGKLFLDDNSFIKTDNFFSGDLKTKLDHINVYSEFLPNDHVRMLLELSYQQKPVTISNGSVGTVLEVFDPISGKTVADTLSKPTPASVNKITQAASISEYGSFSVERAMLQLMINQYINFTAGRFITPAGIWNVDHGSPAILTARQPSQFSIAELFPKAQTGLSVDGRVLVGDADLGYTIYAGGGRTDLDVRKFKDVSAGGQLRLNLPLLNEFRLGTSAYTGMLKSSLSSMHIVLDQSVIAKVQNVVQSEVKAGKIDSTDQAAQIRRLKQLMALEGENPENFRFSTTDTYSSREIVWGADLRTRFLKRLGFQSEVTVQTVMNHKDANKKTTTTGVYALLWVDALKRDNLLLTPYFCAEHIKMKDGQNNPFLKLSGDIPGYNIYMAGINTKLYTNFGVKLEYSIIDILTKGALDSQKDDGDFGALMVQFNIAF